MPTIDKSMMNTHNTYPLSESLPIKYIVIHYTAGVSSKPGQARNTLAYFNSISTASADFAVDDANIMQYADYEKGYRSWHAGVKSYNLSSIGIEICSSNKTGKVTYPNDSNWYFTDAVLDNAVWLVKELLKKYPNAQIIRHYNCSGKQCPAIQGWGTDGKDDSKWKAFVARCKETASASTTTATTTTTTALYRVRKSWADTKSQIGAYASLENAITHCKIKESLGYKVFDANGTQVYPFVSYIVKVTAEELNIRQGPSTSYKIVSSIKDKGKYTIVEEKDGWGKLKSGAGWISLYYTKKI